MELDNLLSSEQSRGRGRNKCFWTDEESDVLIESLQELSCDPMWKTDVGFKNGYMTELHKRIIVKLPNFSKQVSPHIDSKLKWLKSKFHAITEMVNQSGCQWDDVEKKIKCERQWYLSWIQTHKDAKGLWEVKFSYLDMLDKIYGKDRATGQGAMGFEEAVEELQTDLERDAFASINLDDIDFDDEVRSDTPTPTSQDNAQSKKRKKLTPLRSKEKKARSFTSVVHEPQIEAMRKEMSTAMQDMSTHFATIASALADDNNRKQLREIRTNTVVEELFPLGLPTTEKFRAACLLLKDPSALNLFSQLPLEEKRQYVFGLLYPSSSLHGSTSTQ